MQKQNYVMLMQSGKGGKIDFESGRFSNLESCIKGFANFYRRIQYFDFIQKMLDRTKNIVIYKTAYETNEENKVYEMSIEKFKKMLGAEE